MQEASQQAERYLQATLKHPGKRVIISGHTHCEKTRLLSSLIPPKLIIDPSDVLGNCAHPHDTTGLGHVKITADNLEIVRHSPLFGIDSVQVYGANILGLLQEAHNLRRSYAVVIKDFRELEDAVQSILHDDSCGYITYSIHLGARAERTRKRWL